MAANSPAARPPAGPPPWAPPPPSRTSPGRVIATVVGALLFLPALGLLGGGGVLLWADQRERSDDGYLYTASDAFATPGHALVSDRIDLDPGADWVGLSAALGTARVEATGAEPGTNLFVGIAPSADVEAYLGSVERTVVDDLGLDTSAADQVLLPGDAPSGPPADQDFWTVEATGTGAQLDWDPDDGSWTLVVMNADGSAGVAVDARIGATIPALTGLAWGLLGGGWFLLALAVLLLVLGLRRPAAGPRHVPPTPAGAPPYWTPPPPVDRRTAADAQGRTAGTTPRGPQSG